jgi:Fe2+ transport system protein FeoA
MRVGAKSACVETQIVNVTDINTTPVRVQNEELRCEFCPLSRAQTGVAVRIKRLCAAPEVQNHLREIGFGEDQIIRLLTNRSNFICLVCNVRLAISERLAQLIFVETVADSPL